MLVKLNVRVINIIATTYLWSNYLVSSLFPSFSRLKASNNRQRAVWTHSTNYEESIASQKKISIFDTISCQTVIVGSGPAGLATAIMLARAGVKGIKLYDQLNEPVAANDSDYWSNYAADRSYLIGLNGNLVRSFTLLNGGNKSIVNLPYCVYRQGAALFTRARCNGSNLDVFNYS